ncbi:WG repeat-containing protein [Candidatus Obscuribacterales bacterium]|nr:WG repeat-containing protein [Candidatus Obscuribacterales bacterium]
MPNEVDFNELIKLYSVLEQLEPPYDGQLPLQIPDELFAEEYYWLGWRYSKNSWIHHAFECLKRAEALDAEERERVVHMRKTKLPSVIPSVEAVELNLLARNAHRRSRGGENADSNSREIAYSLAKQCVERHPKFESGYMTLAELYEDHGDFRAAVKCYEKVYTFNPNYIDAIVAIGNLWLNRVKLLRAKSWFDQALALEPTNSDARSALYNIRTTLRRPLQLLYPKYQWLEPIFTKYYQLRFQLRRSVRVLKKQFDANPNSYVHGRSGVIDKTGEFLFETDDIMISAKFASGVFCSQGYYDAKFLDKYGKDVFGKSFRWAETFSEDLANVLIDERWGYIDVNGEFTIQPAFEDARPFSNGLAAVRLGGAWGFINKDGEWVVSPSYETVLSFREERAAVSLNGKIAFINLHGEAVTDFEFEQAGVFSDGLAKTVTYETVVNREMVKYLDRNGKVAIDLNRVLRELTGTTKSGPAWRPFNEKYDGYLYAGPPEEFERTLSRGDHRHDFDPTLSQFCDGLLLVRSKGLYGYLNRSGELAIPFQFYDACVFSEGSAWVHQTPPPADVSYEEMRATYLCGFIDKTGAVIIEPAFSHARNFKDGVAYVEAGEKKYFIDKTGRTVFEIGGKVGEVGDFSDGFAPVARRPLAM